MAATSRRISGGSDSSAEAVPPGAAASVAGEEFEACLGRRWSLHPISATTTLTICQDFIIESPLLMLAKMLVNRDNEILPRLKYAHHLLLVDSFTSLSC